MTKTLSGVVLSACLFLTAGSSQAEACTINRNPDDWKVDPFFDWLPDDHIANWERYKNTSLFESALADTMPFYNDSIYSHTRRNTSVPEPSTIALLFAGLAGAASLKKGKKT